MKKFKQVIKCLINFIICFFSFFIIRSDKYVVCGGWFGKRFADNSKAMYLFLSNHKNKLDLKKVIYITKNKSLFNFLKSNGYDTAMSNSLAGLYYQLKSLYHIVDQNGSADLNRYCSVRAIKINLWHGFPIKKIGYHVTNYKQTLDEVIMLNERKCEISNWNIFYNLVQSNKQKELQQFAFGLEDKMMIKGAYPRTLYLKGLISTVILENDKNNFELISKLKISHNKIIGYFPTFRDKSENNLECINCIDFLNGFAKNHDCYILTKLHFASHIGNQINSYDHVINLSPESDVYDFLKFVDILISDYSSITYDYILFKRPMLFYAFDLDYYNNNDRGFLLDYESFCPGKITNNIKDLEKSLEFVLVNTDTYLQEYTKKINDITAIVYDNPNPNIDDMFSLWEKISKLKNN